MAAHRYWRLVGFCVPGTGPLEISEARLYAAGSLVDAAATVSCPFAPTSGALVDLKDGLASAVVTWPFAAHSSPGFLLLWDLTGTGADVDAIRLGSGNAASAFPLDVTLQWSDDLLQWTTSASAAAIVYPGDMSMSSPSSSGGDPYYASVSMLLHCNGGNGSTSFGDSSSLPKTVTAVSGAKISTAQSKFGGASAVFNGTSDYLSTPYGSDFNFGTGNFTVEAFIRPTALTGYTLICGQQEAGTGTVLQFRTNGTVLEAVLRGAGGAGIITIGGGTLNTTTMQHVSLSRSGSTVYLALGGTIVATGTFTQTLTPATSPLFTIGAGDYGSIFSPYAGYVDEVRVTKGVARYTTAFTPPVAQFPDAMSELLDTTVPTPPRVRQVPLAPQRILGAERPAGAARGVGNPLVFADAYNGGIGIVSGTVKEKNTPSNTPLRRRVTLVDERSRLTIRETWSDTVTGNYEFRGIREGVPYTVLSYDHLHNYRAAIADNLFPEVLP